MHASDNFDGALARLILNAGVTMHDLSCSHELLSSYTHLLDVALTTQQIYIFIPFQKINNNIKISFYPY